MKSATGIQKYRVFWLCDKCKERGRHETADLFWECDTADLIRSNSSVLLLDSDSTRRNFTLRYVEMSEFTKFRHQARLQQARGEFYIFLNSA